MVAEGLAAVRWSDPALDDVACCASAAESCARFGVDAPHSVTPDRAAAVRRALIELTARWCGFEEKGTIVLSFDSADPAAGFVEMVRRASLS